MCKLHKSLYELKQTSRQWYAKFSQALLEENFRQSAIDHSLFIKKEDSLFIVLLVCVDDIIITSNDEVVVKITQQFVKFRSNFSHNKK